MDLYICWANVWRSQVAEWFAKNLWKNVISCAWVEARKEKYNFKPEKTVTDIMLNDYNIDISEQEVFYPNDILKYLDKIENIYFLFDPKKAKKSDNEVLVNSITIWDYFDNAWIKYEIHEIEDPDEKDLDTIKNIVSEIKEFIERKT